MHKLTTERRALGWRGSVEEWLSFCTIEGLSHFSGLFCAHSMERRQQAPRWSLCSAVRRRSAFVIALASVLAAR